MQERPGQIGDFWISKRRGSEQWCRTWFDTETRQTRRASLGTGDFEAAKLALYAWFSEHGKLGPQAPQNASVVMLLTRYYQQYAKNIPSSDTARVAVGLWCEFFAGSVVADLKPHRQREFHAWLHAQQSRARRPFSDGYIKRILGVGSAALLRANREGELDSVPYILPGTDGEAKDRVLTVDESQALWDAATLPHERMFLALAYGTLARPEAILDLTRESVDFGRRLIAQNAPGRKQTKKYRPVVPVVPFLLPWLKEAPEGPLVAWHGKPIDSFKTAFRRMRKTAGLGVDVVAKTIRHTMATELRAAGVPEAEIQGVLGHRAYSGKTEVYAKYRPEYLGSATQAIEGYMMGLRVSRVLAADSIHSQPID